MINYSSSLSKTVIGLIDTLRGQYQFDSMMDLFLQLLVWLKESTQGKSSDSSFDLETIKSGEVFENLSKFASLQQEQSGTLYQYAFSSIDFWNQINGALREKLLQEAVRVVTTQVLMSASEQDVHALASAGDSHPSPTVPFELVQLMIELAEITSGTCYTPWDHAGSISLPASLRKIDVFSEVVAPPSRFALVSLLFGLEPKVSVANFLKSPSAITGGQLDQFDVTLMLPPFGMKCAHVVESDYFNRFPEKTTSSTVLSIRHALAQTKRRVVAVVPSNILFSGGVELELRKDLLTKGMIEAVIALPAGLLQHTAISMNVLILDPKGGHENITFVDATDKSFFTSAPKSSSGAKVILKDIDLIINEMVGSSNTIFAEHVTVQDVMEQNALLQVNRYVLPNSQKQLQRLLGKSELKPLSELVEIIRPVALSKESEESVSTDTHHEVTLADLPAFGCVCSASRTVRIERAASQKQSQASLRPNDIILNVKGNVGAIGIIPATLDPYQSNDGVEGWVATQSSYILRMHRHSQVSPVVLFMLLRSPVGQTLLEQIAVQSTLSLINLSALKSLMVPLPTPQEAEHAQQLFEQEVIWQAQINELRAQQKQAVSGLWALNNTDA